MGIPQIFYFLTPNPGPIYTKPRPLSAQFLHTYHYLVHCIPATCTIINLSPLPHLHPAPPSLPPSPPSLHPPPPHSRKACRHSRSGDPAQCKDQPTLPPRHGDAGLAKCPDDCLAGRFRLWPHARHADPHGDDASTADSRLRPARPFPHLRPGIYSRGETIVAILGRFAGV